MADAASVRSDASSSLVADAASIRSDASSSLVADAASIRSDASSVGHDRPHSGHGVKLRLFEAWLGTNGQFLLKMKPVEYRTVSSPDILL